jgi:phosphoribosyl 1,2-cyclic phosphodiesterase
MLSVTFLGSGSRGNAAVVRCGETRVLLDCGFSARETARRMAAVGEDAERVTALLLTHEHTDHVAGVPVFARRHGVPVFATDATASSAGLRAERGVDVHTVHVGDGFAVGELRVRAFETSHDAARPVGYVFETADGTRLGIATDLGVITDGVADALTDCDLIGIEANHDEHMLATGPYPEFLKRRIASARGHLSNAAASFALAILAHDRLRAVIALHVSQQNNTPEFATDALRERAEQLGLFCRISAAAQDSPVAMHLGSACTVRVARQDEAMDGAGGDPVR